MEAVWFYPGEQVQGYTQKANIPTNLAGLSLHTLLLTRRQGCLASETLAPAQLQKQAPVLDTAHDNG